MMLGWGRRGMFTGFLWGNVRDGEHLEDLDIDGSTVSRDRKCICERNATGSVHATIFAMGKKCHIF
jgi:hypothetical protein